MQHTRLFGHSTSAADKASSHGWDLDEILWDPNFMVSGAHASDAGRTAFPPLQRSELYVVDAVRSQPSLGPKVAHAAQLAALRSPGPAASRYSVCLSTILYLGARRSHCARAAGPGRYMFPSGTGVCRAYPTTILAQFVAGGG